MQLIKDDVLRRSSRLIFPLAGALLALAAARASAQQPAPLDGFVREAIRHNLSFQQQRLARERSEAAVTQARGSFLPSLTLDARYSEMSGGLDLGALVNPAYAALNQITGTTQFPTNIDGRFPYAQETRLRLVQPIFQPAVISNYQVRKSLSGLEGARLRASARALAADVQVAYVNYARAQRVVDLYRNTLAVVSEAVRVNEKLLQNGKVTPAALHRAIADRSEVEQQIAQSERQRNAAARLFNFLLGRDAEAPIEAIPDSLLFRPVTATVDQLLNRALSMREELEQARWGVRAHEAEARLARSSFLPGISVAVDYGVQGNEYRFDSRNDVAVASLVFSWNLFNGGQDAARRQQALLDVERANVGKREAEQQIELQVRQAFDAVKVAETGIRTADDRLNSARRSFELMRRRYNEGVASQLEFVDARTTYTNAELNWILTRHEYIASCIELERVAATRDIDLTDLERND